MKIITRRGFTFVEMILVLALIAGIASFTASESLASFNRILTRIDGEQNHALHMAAKLKTLHHVCDGGDCIDSAAHGLYSTGTNRTVFQGSSYATRDSEEDLTVSRFIPGTSTSETVYSSEDVVSELE